MLAAQDFYQFTFSLRDRRLIVSRRLLAQFDENLATVGAEAP